MDPEEILEIIEEIKRLQETIRKNGNQLTKRSEDLINKEIIIRRLQSLGLSSIKELDKLRASLGEESRP